MGDEVCEILSGTLLSVKNVLIVSYLFPPDTGVGGRRWSKFAKYLVEEGKQVSVLTSEKDNYSDGDNSQFKMYFLPKKYPRILTEIPRNIIGKLKYRLYKIYLEYILKGNIYDKTILWEKNFVSKVTEIISRDEVDTLIVTGPPFGILNYAAKVRKNAEVKLVLDLRDPWTWENKGFGYEGLKGKNLEFAKLQELEAIKYADLVLVPVQDMKEHLVTTYPDYEFKFKVIPHGYDKDDFKSLGVPAYKKPSTDNVHLLYYGTLYRDMEECFEKLAQVIGFNENIHLDIYTWDTEKYTRFFKTKGILGKRVNYHSPVSSNEIMTLLAKADYMLFPYPWYLKDQLITKYFEIFYSRKPIILLSMAGEVGKFIEDNKLGVSITYDQITEKLPIILETGIEYNEKFDLSDFDYINLTKEVVKLTKEVKI